MPWPGLAKWEESYIDGQYVGGIEDVLNYNNNGNNSNNNSNNNNTPNNNSNNNNNENNTNNNGNTTGKGEDTTTANEDIPKTGFRNTAIILAIGILSTTIIFYIKYKKLNSYVK